MGKRYVIFIEQWITGDPFSTLKGNNSVKMEPEIEGKPWRGLEVKSNLRKSYNEHSDNNEVHFAIDQHWNNRPSVDISLHSHTQSRFRTKQSLSLLLNAANTYIIGGEGEFEDTKALKGVLKSKQ
jgi:hypothetical protein